MSCCMYFALLSDLFRISNFKKQKAKTKLNFKSKNLEEYNRPFSLDELRKSLDKAHDTACGPNDIHFQLLKHLPESEFQTLLDLMHDI